MSRAKLHFSSSFPLSPLLSARFSRLRVGRGAVCSRLVPGAEKRLRELSREEVVFFYGLNLARLACLFRVLAQCVQPFVEFGEFTSVVFQFLHKLNYSVTNLL
jgi:hypothetical protein